MIHVTINGKPVEVSEGSTIMEAAETVGIRIPSLCHMKNVHQYGSCRICVVEVEGMKNLQASCMAKVREGMVIRTHSPKVLAARKVLYELLLSNHPRIVSTAAGIPTVSFRSWAMSWESVRAGLREP